MSLRAFNSLVVISGHDDIQFRGICFSKRDQHNICFQTQIYTRRVDPAEEWRQGNIIVGKLLSRDEEVYHPVPLTLSCVNLKKLAMILRR